MMKTNDWASYLTNLALNKRKVLLIVLSLITVISLFLATHLEMRMNWMDLLPAEHPIVQGYREVQDRFGDPSIIIVLEGDRHDIVELAEFITPGLESMESIYNVQSKFPQDFIRHHAFVNMKPSQFKRSLKMYSDRSLLGSFQGLNHDYETEYTGNESNLKRDEIEVARGIMGLTRSLEILRANIVQQEAAPRIEEAVDAFTLGDPWTLSLDRDMLLISCVPQASLAEDINATIDLVEDIESLLIKTKSSFPEVESSLTGMGVIARDEMNSVGLYTQMLTILALILVYFLLARTFRSWITPLIALLPLLVGIIWTMGLLYLLFGGLNLFTAMIMLVLLGLGIDFSIHLVARFREEMHDGNDVTMALKHMLEDTGTGVLTGALTTAMAFLTLMIAEADGIFEFGVAAGLGVLLTLLAIFLLLPALLVIHHNRQIKKKSNVNSSDEVKNSNTKYTHSYDWIGKLAGTSWKYSVVFLLISILVSIASYFAMRNIEFEYNFLELEAKGLKSVELQDEIPEKFGTADHSAWIITENIEESRDLKEKLRDQAMIGEVVSISDFIPSEQRRIAYEEELKTFRSDILKQSIKDWQSGDREALAGEIDRLWDNLDLVSNLAFTAGLDRIVKVIDNLSGYDSQTNTTDTLAILPSLSRLLHRKGDLEWDRAIAEAWSKRMTTNLYSMADPSPVKIEELPETFSKIFIPKIGKGFLLQIFPRESLWSKDQLVRFDEQTRSIHSGISGSEQLILLMMDKTLEEGRNAALLALIVITILLLIHFRGLAGILALIPLLTGSLMMLGFMYILGMKYNYMNLIAVPIILGIGIDDGVHALHRFRHEVGIGIERVYNSYRFVGRAILLTSLTTMAGFGSVAFYEMRGMASFGLVLFIGVGACFLSTILILPAVLRIFYAKKK